MIGSFRDTATEKIFYSKKPVKGISSELHRAAKKKLMILNSAETLDDLKVPPGNRLEPLRGDRKGYHSIRVNDQWRICFRFVNGNVQEVELVDYH